MVAISVRTEGSIRVKARRLSRLDFANPDFKYGKRKTQVPGVLNRKILAKCPPANHVATYSSSATFPGCI